MFPKNIILSFESVCSTQEARRNDQIGHSNGQQRAISSIVKLSHWLTIKTPINQLSPFGVGCLMSIVT